MKNELFNILIVDDNGDIHDDFKQILLKGNASLSTLKSEANDILNQLLDTNQDKHLEEVEKYAITSSFQGLDAIELVKNEQTPPFALAFIDMRMPPGIDGLETLKQIHHLDENIEIVICTAYQDYDVEHILRETEHVNGIMLIKKPFDPLEIQFIARTLCKKWLYKKINKILVNSTIEAIFSMDNSGYLNYANTACLNMLGLNGEDEIIGKNISEFIQNENSNIASSLLSPVSTGIVESGDNILFKNKVGRVFPVQYHAYPLMHIQNIIGVVITFINISDRKESENKVKEAYESLEAKVEDRTKELNDKIKLLNIIEEAQMAFISTKTPNDAFMKIVDGLVDLTESEYGFIGEVLQDAKKSDYLKIHAISGNAWESIPKEILNKFEVEGLNFFNVDNLFRDTVVNGKVVISNKANIEVESHNFPEGHPVINTFMGLPIKNGDKIIGVAGVANRKSGYNESLVDSVSLYLNTTSNLLNAFRNEVSIQQARMELLKSELMHRTVISNMVDGLVTINKKGIILSFNPAFSDMFGYTDIELLHKNISILLPEDQANLHDSFLNDYFNSDSKRNDIIGKVRQLIAKKKDGTTFDIELAVSEISVDNEIVLTGIIRDVAYRRIAEGKLIKAKEDAEKANKAKSEFLSSMSHELRTPMNAILGFGQLLELNEDIHEGAKEWTREIINAGNHLLELINEVLDLSRIEAGKLELTLVNLSLKETIDRCYNLVVPLSAKMNITLDISNINNFTVYADETRLRQVLINVFSNSIKYNSQNGCVDVSCNETSDGMIEIHVKDTGIGISADNLQELFKPFSRVSDDVNKVEGTGIGLVITKSLIEEMNGSISVTSEKNKGTEFVISLPKSKFSDEDVTSNSNVEDISTGDGIDVKDRQDEKLVIYIEDNPANLRLVEFALASQKKYKLITATTPSAGLELITNHNPSLILLDINLPEMDGYQLLSIIRKNPQIANIPVIAISANAMADDIVKGENAGLYAYITKPIDIKNLLETIDKALN